MKKNAVLMPNWVGDFILALSVVQNRFSPKDNVTLIIPEKLASLSKVINPFPTILYSRTNSWELKSTILEIQREKFDRIYLLPRSFSAAYLAWRGGIRHRRGIQSEMRSILLTDRLPRSTENRSVHLTREYARILNIPYVPPELHKGYQLKNTVRTATGQTIVLCPGAAFGETKRWRYFRELPKRLPYCQFTILGDGNDVEPVRNMFPSSLSNVENIVGKTTLAEAAAIIASSTMVVANDSGLLHLAGYLGKPAIGIYGSTSPCWTRPLGREIVLLSSDSTCAPCFKKVCQRSDFDCLYSITPDSVIGRIVAMLTYIEKSRLQTAYSHMVNRMTKSESGTREPVV